MTEFLNPLFCLFRNNPLAAMLFGLISVFIPLLFNYLSYKSNIKPISEESDDLENQIANFPQN
jgi:hypothetical protein